MLKGKIGEIWRVGELAQRTMLVVDQSGSGSVVVVEVLSEGGGPADNLDWPMFPAAANPLGVDVWTKTAAEILPRKRLARRLGIMSDEQTRVAAIAGVFGQAAIELGDVPQTEILKAIREVRHAKRLSKELSVVARPPQEETARRR